jgi:hypothetical protein
MAGWGLLGEDASVSQATADRVTGNGPALVTTEFLAKSNDPKFETVSAAKH